MRGILDHHRPYTCSKTNEGTQHHHELLLRHVLCPPDEEPK
jgi:hypothetical protein